MGAFAHFVLIPLMLVALTIEPTFLAPQAEREGVRRLFQKGRMSAARAFRAGALVGAVALGSAIGIGFSLNVLTAFDWWFFLAVAAPVLLGAKVGQAWIVQLAKEEAIDRVQS
jgi:hypothetical protein